MYFSRLFFTLIFAISATFSTLANAEVYKMVVAFSAGSQSDTIARMIQRSIEKNTNDKLVIVNLPGADQAIGANKFINDHTYDIMMSSSSMDVFVPIMKPNIGYKFADFEHAIYAGTQASVWVTSATSKIKTTNDMLEHMPEFIGTYAMVYETNVMAVKKKFNANITIVSYKSGNDVLRDIVGGQLEMGIMAVSPSIIAWAKEGKVRIIGSTYHKDVTVDGVHIPSSAKTMNLPGFSGFSGFDLRPSDTLERKEKLKKILWTALKDPETAEGIKKLLILPDSSNDKEWIYQYINDYRKRVGAFINPVK
tara:strand:- start:852 stop:1775 length:924 start_codon:yes stop_codon:yes gene_type:complete